MEYERRVGTEVRDGGREWRKKIGECGGERKLSGREGCCRRDEARDEWREAGD